MVKHEVGRVKGELVKLKNLLRDKRVARTEKRVEREEQIITITLLLITWINEVMEEVGKLRRKVAGSAATIK